MAAGCPPGVADARPEAADRECRPGSDRRRPERGSPGAKISRSRCPTGSPTTGDAPVARGRTPGTGRRIGAVLERLDCEPAALRIRSASAAPLSSPTPVGGCPRPVGRRGYRRGASQAIDSQPRLCAPSSQVPDQAAAWRTVVRNRARVAPLRRGTNAPRGQLLPARRARKHGHGAHPHIVGRSMHSLRWATRDHGNRSVACLESSESPSVMSRAEPRRPDRPRCRPRRPWRPVGLETARLTLRRVPGLPDRLKRAIASRP